MPTGPMRAILTLTILLAALPVLGACDDTVDIGDPEQITTVIVTFDTNGVVTTATYNDPDGPGGSPPLTDSPLLTGNTTYAVAVRLQNRLANPIAEVTDEIRVERAGHLVLFTGSGVVGPATTNASGPLTHAYADTVDDRPLGLANTLVAKPGSGELRVTLRHLGVEVSSDHVVLARDEGIDALDGTSDIAVTFQVVVQ